MRRFSRRNMGGLQVDTPQYTVASQIFVRRDTTVYTPPYTPQPAVPTTHYTPHTLLFPMNLVIFRWA